MVLRFSPRFLDCRVSDDIVIICYLLSDYD